jgi:hypothetical protein
VCLPYDFFWRSESECGRGPMMVFTSEDQATKGCGVDFRRAWVLCLSAATLVK